MPPQQHPHQPVVMPQYEEETPRPPKKRRGEGWRALVSTLSVIAAAILFAVALTSFVFQSYQVDGPSMEPTLQNGDRLIIWKVPRTIERITGNIWIPDRGDIVVFVEKGLAAPDGSSKQLIKRVVGLPGDRIIIEDGVLTVYNSEHPDGFHPDTTLPYGEGKAFMINNNEEVDERVGEDQIFVLGDNRNNSLDSRSFGSVNAEDIIGELKLRIFPLNNAKGF